MLHNVVLVSAVQQSYMYTLSPYLLPLEPPSHPPYPTPLSHHKALS